MNKKVGFSMLCAFALALAVGDLPAQ